MFSTICSSQPTLVHKSIKVMAAALMGLLLAGFLPAAALMSLVSAIVPVYSADALPVGFSKWLPGPSIVLAADGADNQPNAFVMVGSRLWLEDDFDGDAATGTIQSVGAGYVVTALASDGQTVYTGTTDMAGVYAISLPADDTYTVTTTLPDGLVDIPVLLNSGIDPLNNYNRNHDRLGTKVVVTATDNLSINFGFYSLTKLVSLGDRLWFEDDYDGDATTGTVTPVGAGHVVTALASDGVTTYTGVTDANGGYLILVPEYDTYTVTTDQPAGTGDTPVIVNHGNNLSNNNHNHDRLGTTVVITESDNLSIDFGFFIGDVPPPTVNLGNYVWFDSDGNGTQNEPASAGRDGITVTLTYPSGMTATQLTTNGGYYTFTHLLPNQQYTVHFALPTGYSFTTPVQGGDNALDSNPSGSGAVVVNLGNQDDYTIDAGMIEKPPVQLASLGDFVWEDLNGNGQQDGNEPAIANVSVTLTLPDATQLQTATDANGFYTFTNLLPGIAYTVTFGTPAGYTSTGVDMGNNDLGDSDGQIVVVAPLTPGEHNGTIDSGFVRLQPVLVLTKAAMNGTSMVQPGTLVSYALTYSNTGNAPAVGAVITETVSAYTTFVAGASTPGWNCANGAVAGTLCTFALGDLLPGQSGTIVFAVEVEFGLSAGITISNIAYLASEDDQVHGVSPIVMGEVTLVTAGPTGLPERAEPGKRSFQLYLPIASK